MVSRNDVIYAYQFLLQRPPESDRAIASHSGAESVDQLRWAIMRSPEYVQIVLGSQDIHRVPLLNFTHIHTVRMTARRQEHLATLALPLRNRTVIEIGAGIGLHAPFFLDRGCSVLSTDGRPENVETMRALFDVYGWYAQRDRFRADLFDVECDDPARLGKFEIVYCYGLLYHTKAPDIVIQKLGQLCKDILLLETSVSFGDSNEVIYGTEDPANVSQGVHGAGSHPTRSWILSELHKHFEYVYIPRTQPNHEYFPVDWITPPPSSNQTIRAVFVASKAELKSSELLTSLPDKQEYAS